MDAARAVLSSMPLPACRALSRRPPYSPFAQKPCIARSRAAFSVPTYSVVVAIEACPRFCCAT